MQTPSDAPPRWPGAVAAAILTVWGLLTMARDLMWFDAGELALTGVTAGLGHPPGQPLYTALLAGLARLPGVEPLVAMNALSAVAAGLCALPVDALMVRLTQARPIARLVSLLAVGGLAPLWDQATRIELYALATLLMLVILSQAISRAQAARAGDETALSVRRWISPGLMVGFLVCVNPVFAVLSVLAVSLVMAPVLVRRWSTALPTLGGAVIGGLLGLAPYAWLPLVISDRAGRFVWGNWASSADVSAYLLGADYAHTAHSAWTSVPDHLTTWLAWMIGQGAWPVLLLAVVGWCLLALKRPVALAIGVPALVLGVGFTFTYGVYFPEIPDFNGYLAPAMWLGALGLAAVGSPMTGRIGARVVTPLLAWALALSLTLGERPIWSRSRAGLKAPRALASAWLEAAPRDAVLLVESDHLVFPLMYLQQAEGVRPDVVIFNWGFGASRWYWDSVRARHPDLPTIEVARYRDTTSRLMALLAQAPERPVQVESAPLALRLRRQPCLATWGFAVDARCAAEPHEEGDLASITRWLDGADGRDLISPRVLAQTGLTRAIGAWMLERPADALDALRASAGRPDLPIPGELAVQRPPPPPMPPAGTVLIGDPQLNLLVGAWMAERAGASGEALATWQAAAQAHR